MISTKQKYNLYKPKKFLGQNFLVDDNIAKKIVASLDIKPDDVVIEIGPGQGVLTKYLYGLSKNFYAVEIDKSIFVKLNSQFGNKIKLIHKDFLKIDFDSEINTGDDKSSLKLKIIGNIPYNITTEILFKLYEANDKMDSAILMMQKEVARRVAAKPNTKEYGIIAIHTQYYTTPKILFNVPPTAFFPKPNVDSAIVKLDFNKNISNHKENGLFKELVKESFGQRRKTMRNSLKKLFQRREVEFENIDFDFSRRPENVTIKEFEELSHSVYRLVNKI